VVVLINLQSFWIKRLAQELRCGHVVPIFHDPGHMMELRSLVSGYKNLVLEIVRTKNRYKATITVRNHILADSRATAQLMVSCGLSTRQQ
jgi:hypothetical protein